MILVKTEAGQRVLKDRSIALTPRQRSAFILCDGKRSVVDVLEAGMGVSREEIDQMIAQGLLALVGEGGVAVAAIPAASPAPAPAPVAAAPAAGRSDQQRYKDAYPIATQLTGSLGLRGFRLNLSVEGTANYEQLLALLPKIEAAVGPEKAAALERALRGA
jgi:hypothetical protein